MLTNQKGHVAPASQGPIFARPRENPAINLLIVLVSFRLVASCLAAVTPSATAAEGPPDLEQLTKRHAAAAATLKELKTKLAAVRADFAKGDELVKLSKKLNEANKARDAKASSDPKVAEARQALADATAAARKAFESELPATPEHAAIARELNDLDEDMKKLQAEERTVQSVLSEVQRKVAQQPALEKLAQAQAAAAEAALGKAAGSAEEKAARRATNVYEAALRAKTLADPQGAEQTRKLNQLAADFRTNAKARKVVEAKKSELLQKLMSRKDRVIPARQAEIDAALNLRIVLAQQTAAESDAAEAAEKAYQDALDARFAANPSAAALRQQVEALSKEVNELAADIRLAQKAADR